MFVWVWQDDPMANWEVKYRLDSGRPLPREKVALYGSQILEVSCKCVEVRLS